MEIIRVNTTSELREAFEQLRGAPVLSADTETTGFSALSEEMTLLQLSPNPDKAFVIDTRKCNDPNDYLWLKEILASDRVVMFQNAKFDLQFLTHFFKEPLLVENLYDTFPISIILARGNKTLGHSLGAIAERELGITLDKSLQRSDFGASEFSREQIEYAARDATVLHGIRDSQKQKLREWGLERVARLECDAVAPIADAEYRGIYLDAAEWTERCQGQRTKHSDLEHQIYKQIEPACIQIDLFGQPVINLDSPQQLGPALRNLGIPIRESTDEAALKMLRDSHPIMELLIEYREMATALKKYGLKYLDFISSVDGRIHADFQQIEAPSGRMSCRRPNLQQLPAEKEYRQVFKAQNGGHIIGGDFSQVELRIMAKLSGDPTLVKAYMNGEDIHNVTAINVLGEPPDNINPDRRRIAKNANFGTAYGVSPEGFAVTAGVTVAFADQVLKKFWQTYRILGDYLRDQASLAADQGRAYTMSGRSAILFVNREDQQAYAAARRLGRNFSIQGTGADILKRALYLFRRQIILRKLDAWVVNIIHDEIVVETNDDPEIVAGILRDTMVEAGMEYLDPIPVVVDIKIGTVWKK